MKKTLFTLALAAGLTGSAQAQRPISLGLKAGGTYSTLTGSDVPNSKGLFGFHAGAFTNIGLSRIFAFQPELVYSQKGSRYSTTEAVDRLSYLDIPLSVHANVKGFFLEAGPQLGLLLSASRRTGSVTFDEKNLYNELDFGYLLGVGYQRKSGPGIGLRYNGAFTNVPQDYTVGTTTYQKQVRNSAFQLYLTYSFGGR